MQSASYIMAYIKVKQKNDTNILILGKFIYFWL